MDTERAAPDAVAAPTKPATIYDVARVAGVSHQTVSRYLKGYEGIRPATRERVEHALKALDYRVNLAARSLATRRSNRVAALVHDIVQVGPSKTAQGASSGAHEAGYVLDFIALDFRDRTAIDEALELINRQDLAGVVALSSTDDMAAAFAATDFRMPAYIVPEDEDDDDLASDDPLTVHGHGMKVSVDHLVELGHRRFFYIAGPTGWSSARNRTAAYHFALEHHGITSLGQTEGDWSPASGYDAAQRVAVHTDATALVVANDQMALGAMLALEEAGKRVPDDVSVVGFDDIPEARFFRPPLTTVRQDFDLQGRIAFGRLLQLIDGPGAYTAPPNVPDLVVRRSTAAALRA
ncbi:LacI family DNA-binding transcriptional regulator [Agromyces mangrovi Wang et al. 2018]|uniref:LacI family DNA-binding transcriptional regulator n=1 Tax=Agromyces mangrovi TaxID=1858653 RepID=UPI00257335ED|nr:LacI family DNA-binding transcriptional regulator [Agromyces mangrovi]BDZ65339.1 LacI family transcriptional regulator [Agromyces mangrovi]